MSLGDALDELEKDEVIKSALPGRNASGVHALQTRRMGAVPGDRDRVGPQALTSNCLTADGEERREQQSCAELRDIIHRGNAPAMSARK